MILCSIIKKNSPQIQWEFCLGKPAGIVCFVRLHAKEDRRYKLTLWPDLKKKF